MAKTIQKTCQMKYAVHGRRAHKRTFLVIFMSFASTGFCFAFFSISRYIREREKNLNLQIMTIWDIVSGIPDMVIQFFSQMVTVYMIALDKYRQQ